MNRVLLDPPDGREDDAAPAARVEPVALLLVEDSPADVRLLQEHLREAIESGEVMLQVATRLSEARQALARMEFSAVLLDLGLPDAQGVETIEILRTVDPAVAMIVLSAFDSDDMAEQAMQLGVQDYVVKGRYDGALLLRRIRYAVQGNRQLARLNQERRESFLTASREPNTGLPSRALFEDRVESVLAQAERTGIEIGLVRIQLDGFADLVDEQGRPLAEAIARRAAALLNGAARRSDTVACLGGSEFAVALVPTDDSFDAGTVARRFHELLRGLDFEPARIIDSIGVARYPAHGLSLAALFEASGQAMYRARRAGGGVVVFDARPEQPAGPRPHVTGDAASALTIEPLFQPWVDLREGRYAGVETILSPLDRSAWRRATAEEKRGCGYDLIGRVCGLLRAWRDEGLALPAAAIDLDPALIEQPDLLEFLEQQTEAAGLSPLDLRLEVPATIVADGSSDQIGRLRLLRDHGFPIVLDHFLTSAESFLALAAMPLDGIKICRDVLVTLPLDRPGGSVRRAISATVGAAAGLGLDVIASGVESIAMRQTLRALGCRYGQGELLCEPLSATALPARWREGPAAVTP